MNANVKNNDSIIIRLYADHLSAFIDSIKRANQILI